MKRGVVVCLVVAACMPPPPARVPTELTAATILGDVDATYAKAHTYADHGRQSDTLASVPPNLETRIFETAFMRDQVLRFQYLREADPRRAHVIWSSPSRTLTSWYMEPGVVVGKDAISELGAAMGVSGGISGFVPPLLLRHAELGSVTAIRGATRESDEAIDGHPCWRITGTQRDFTVTMWIDMQTHLIRQIERRYRLNGLDGDEITRYEPQVDVPLDATHIPPPDNHGEPPRLRAEPAWLGVMFDGHSGTTRVQSVVSGGPAEHAGVQPGDVITKIDSQQVGKAAEVVTRVRGERPGTKLHVTLTRGGKEVPLDVTLEKRPDLDDLQGRLVGHPAPDFALASLSGPASAKLADLKGHVVIVDFWATWCGPCGIAMPHLVDLSHKYKDLRVVGISDEEEADIKKYVADHKIDYTIARDADDVVTGHYLVTGLPTLVIVDKAGVVRALHVGAGDFDAIEAEVQQYLK